MLLTKSNLLVVEQSGDCRKIIEANLQKPRFFVFAAKNLAEATAFLRTAKPDVLFLSADVADAYLDVCRMLASKGMPVVLLHPKPTRDLILDASRSGILDLLVVPLEPKTVVSRTQKALVRLGKALPEKHELKVDLGASKTPREKVGVLLGKVNELLALPFAVARVIQLCNSSTASATDLVQPIRADPALASMILRRANSVTYGGRELCTAMQQAVVRIGVRETRNIAATFSVFDLFSKETKSFGFNRFWFWLHALTVAAAAQFLAKQLKLRQPEDAFLAGLLHDIGKMVLDDFLNTEYQSAISKAGIETMPIRKAELAIFEVDHAYVGGKLAEQWKLPDFVCEAIANHHQYEKMAAEEKPTLPAVVCLADQVAKAMRIGHGGDFIIEDEAVPLGKHLPAGLVWPDAVMAIRKEVVEQIQVLKIASDFFKLDPIPERKQAVAIVAPEPSPYTTLLQIVLAGMGLPCRVSNTLDDPKLAESKPAFCVGDFAPATDRNPVAAALFKLGGVAPKHVVLSRFPDLEPALPLPLDTYVLERMLRKELELDAVPPSTEAAPPPAATAADKTAEAAAAGGKPAKPA
jgi:putative nucleotidyltransferase with HDIG domain